MLSLWLSGLKNGIVTNSELISDRKKERINNEIIGMPCKMNRKASLT